MLKIIDRYIIKKFLSTFFFMLGIIMLLAMVFDVSEKLSEFISNKAPMSEIIFDYYVNFILFYGNTFSSMIIFISVIWFTAKMAQDTEIIPIWFNGRPITRFLRPYMIGATILMILSFVLNHFIVPRSSKVRLAFEEKYYRDVLSVEDYQAEYPGNELVYFSNYTSSENQIHDLTIQKWNEENEPIYFFRARTIKSIPGTNRWSVKDYYEKNYEFPKGKLLYGSRKDTTFSFTLEEIAQRENVAETMTFSELTRFACTYLRNRTSPANILSICCVYFNDYGCIRLFAKETWRNWRKRGHRTHHCFCLHLFDEDVNRCINECGFTGHYFCVDTQHHVCFYCIYSIPVFSEVRQFF